MIVLHIACLDERKSSGPNINVPKNILYGNKYAQVALFNLKESNPPVKLPKNAYFSIKDFKSVSGLPEPFNRPDIVIFQGIYFVQYCQIAKWLRKNSIPYIIVPRCSMTTAAIKSHALKKKIANILFFNKFVKNADKIQFLTQNEYEESKNNFKFRNYFILGNGVELPTAKYKVKNRDEFKIVFVGRYNIYHKGLDVLLDAVSCNKEWFKNNEVSLLLYGSDSDNGLTYLKERITKENLGDTVRICGPVFNKEKEKALLDADIFIHTSRLEGQPTSVIEAISYGVPVIVTPGTNVSDIVKDKKMGYVARMDSESILKTIMRAFNDKKQFGQLSQNEVRLSKEIFNWDVIISQSLKEYSNGK